MSDQFNRTPQDACFFGEIQRYFRLCLVEMALILLRVLVRSDLTTQQSPYQ